MMDAMQITVSSEIAKRMDDSNSTAERHAREPVCSTRPWVETVMRSSESSKKKAGHHVMDPPVRVVSVRLVPENLTRTEKRA